MVFRLIVISMLSVLMWTGTLLHEVFENINNESSTISIHSVAKSVPDENNCVVFSNSENHCHDAVIASGRPSSYKLSDSFVQPSNISNQASLAILNRTNTPCLERAPPNYSYYSSRLYLINRSLLI